MKHKAVIQYVVDCGGFVPLRSSSPSLYKGISDIYMLKGSFASNNRRRHQVATVLINNGFLEWDKDDDIVYVTEKGRNELMKGA